jgi:cilia- and flagella-associated protein 298
MLHYGLLLLRIQAVSEDERKAMMAFYFKRQEELKKLAEANDDDYLASSWADPKQLQKSLRGTGTIQAPGVRRA